MNLLFLGDVFGEPGRYALKAKLPELRERHRVDVTVVNAENIAHGRGITPAIAEELFALGVSVITTGNHAFDQQEILAYFAREPRLLRPANYSARAPGRGWVTREVYSSVRIGVINLAGRVHMEPADCPFACVDAILAEAKGDADVWLVDMHAEATSEKRAMGWHLDGRVAAVLGSHSHVPTADEEILPRGTAYLSDAGMTGPYASVIGAKVELALQKFITGVRPRMEPATGDIRIGAVLVEIEESTGLARRIHRFSEKVTR